MVSSSQSTEQEKYSHLEQATVSQRKRYKDTPQEVPRNSGYKCKSKVDFHVYEVWTRQIVDELGLYRQTTAILIKVIYDE